MNSLRRGQYGSRIVFFNHSTGEYEEYDYVLEKTYDNMAHLGGQKSLNTLTSTQKNLSKTPSKLMSVVLDHETWYNEPGIANPEDEKAKVHLHFQIGKNSMLHNLLLDIDYWHYNNVKLSYLATH